MKPAGFFLLTIIVMLASLRAAEPDKAFAASPAANPKVYLRVKEGMGAVAQLSSLLPLISLCGVTLISTQATESICDLMCSPFFLFRQRVFWGLILFFFPFMGWAFYFAFSGWQKDRNRARLLKNRLNPV